PTTSSSRPRDPAPHSLSAWWTRLPGTSCSRRRDPFPLPDRGARPRPLGDRGRDRRGGGADRLLVAGLPDGGCAESRERARPGGHLPGDDVERDAGAPAQRRHLADHLALERGRVEAALAGDGEVA